MKYSLCYTLLLLVLLPQFLFAQDFGKLAGKIIDHSTGLPIPNATIMLSETNLNATADIGGNYTIVGIPLSTYSARVSADGYNTQVIQHVVLHLGLTQHLEVELDQLPDTESSIRNFQSAAIQKDLIGAPKTFRSKQLSNQPMRGPIEVARTQAGIVSFDGFSDLHFRGGRANQIDYYLDGVKLPGEFHLHFPQSAIEQLSIQTGYLNPRYGDAMAGVINITSKANATQLFGSLEALTSESLDAFGYNLISGSVGGPLFENKLNFFLAGEYTDQFDSAPSAIGQLRVNPSALDDLRAFPIGFRATTHSGDEQILPIPASLSDGAQLIVDDNGYPVINDDLLAFSDGTQVSALGIDSSMISLWPVRRADHISPEDLSVEKANIGQQKQNLSLYGSLAWDVFPKTKLRAGGYLLDDLRDHAGPNFDRRAIFASDMIQNQQRNEYLVFTNLTQRISSTAMLHLSADYWQQKSSTFDPRFEQDWDSLLDYGDIDSPVYDVLRGYKSMWRSSETRIHDSGTPNDPSDDSEFTVLVPTYNTVFRDGQGSTTSDEVIASLVQVPGGRFNSFEQGQSERLRLSGFATTEIGIHQIEFGAAYEKSRHRFWQINAPLLSRFVADGDPEQIDPGNPFFNPNGYTSYNDIPLPILDAAVGVYYGYDLRGQNEVNTESFTDFLDYDSDKSLEAYNQAPYEPIQYSAYIEDKIEWHDIVLNVGVRAEIFDNNMRVLKDPFSRRSVCRVSDVGSMANGVNCGSGTVPANLEQNYAVFYNGDDFVGFRDIAGNFYDAVGSPSEPLDILFRGQTRQTSNMVTEDLFTDFKPHLEILPRIGLSLAASEATVLFAGYEIRSQPPTNNFATLAQFEGTGRLNNTNLKPERMKKIEIGLHHQIAERVSATASGFYYQGENLVGIRDLYGATPRIYSSSNNKGTSTSRGLELTFNLDRTKGLNAHFNYTLSFSESTRPGSHAAFFWEYEGVLSNFPFPSDHDQRHNFNLFIDYVLEENGGPKIFGIHPFEHLNINVLAKAGSGFPYTATTRPTSHLGPSLYPAFIGAYNSTRMPAHTRIDLQISKRFFFQSARSSATLFLWVQNLFNFRNINQVWPYTGQPDIDGFLSSSGGTHYIEESNATARALYEHRSRIPSWVGIPRLVKLGLRLEF